MLQSTFFLPVSLSVAVLGGVYAWGGWQMLAMAVLLSILEVTLSFDNAVVNAKVLSQMSDVWRKRFLTWGILVAVFGTRLVLPILIVSVSAFVSPWAITKLALFAPEAYGHLLEGVDHLISAFGGAFLFMVALKYFFNAHKDVHWIRSIERQLVRWGRIEAIEISLALIILSILSVFSENPYGVLVAGIIGIVLFVVMQGVTQVFSVDAQNVATQGLALFVYLNILDSAFSLDGVVGAFALTSELAIIVVGLGIGAYFVRAITVYLVEKKTLDELRYLEHGAHWAIFALALSMLVGILVHVPEVVIGLAGLVFVVAAYYSSLKHRHSR